MGDRTHVREARIEDAAVIGRLLEQLGYADEAGAIGGRLAAWVSDTNAGRVLVAERAGDVVGVLALHRVPRLEREGAIGRVVALAVDRGHRRAGVASDLLAAGRRVALELGCTVLEVMTHRDRAEARAFYAHHGFSDACARSARYELAL